MTIKITKLWRLCGVKMAAEDKAKCTGNVADLEKPLDDPTKEALDTAWIRRHNFNLADSRLLIDNMVGRLYREVNSVPPRFPVLFLEQLRTRSSLERKTTLALLVKAGEVPCGTEVVADTVNGSFEIFLRGRALFSSIAFVSIQKHAWFTYEDAEFFSEKLLGFVNQEFRGRRPPLTFYVSAWATTMQRMSESIRTGGCTLSAVVRQTAQWENLWTQWTPDAADSVAGPDDDDLMEELDRTRRLAASLQSQRDVAEQQLNMIPNVGNKGNFKGKGKGKKNGNFNDNRQQQDDGDRGRGARGGKPGKRAFAARASSSGRNNGNNGNFKRGGGFSNARWSDKRGR